MAWHFPDEMDGSYGLYMLVSSSSYFYLSEVSLV